MKRVLFFGIYDPGYARSRILAEGFVALGYEVVSCCVDPRAERGLRKYRTLWKRGRALRKELFDHVFVLFPGQTVVWLARLLFGGRVVFDAFVSLYDSNVFDRKKYGPHSLGAWRDWLLDRTSCVLARKVLVDTAEHKRYFVEQLGTSERKLLVVPVGASNEWFAAPAEEAKKQAALLRVIFYGSYIPLHGVEIIVRAAALLSDLPLQFELIGAGQEYRRVRALADSLQLTHVSFEERIPLESLITRVRAADICLGIFGSTPKASRVIPNKVYECAALGKPIITADTPAIREAFTDRELYLCDPAPEALAEAFRVLAADSTLCSSLGMRAQARMREEYTSLCIVSALQNALPMP